MEEKRYSYVFLMIVTIFLTGVLAFTFAYIGKPTSQGTMNMGANILSNSVVDFSYSGSTSLTLDIDSNVANLTPSAGANDYSSYIDGPTASTVVGLTTNASAFPNGVTCTYSIVYTPDVPYTPSSGAVTNGLRELVIIGTNGSENFEQSIAGSTATTLISTSISTTSALSTVSQTWTYKFRFYNFNFYQESYGDYTSGVISITNGNCLGV